MTVLRGRKDGIVHELRRFDFDESEFMVKLRCERARIFGSQRWSDDMRLYGPSKVMIVDDPVDCMACIAERCT